MGPVEYNDDGTIMDEIIKCWFLKPLKRSKAMKLGSVNEHDVLKSLTSFLITHDKELEVTIQPICFGLVTKKRDRWLSTSADGIMECRLGQELISKITPIEIKTFSDRDLLCHCKRIAIEEGRVLSCNFGADLFKKCIRTVKYRVQVLHHALVFEAEQVWFVVADAHSIIFALAVKVSNNVLESYRTILKHFVDQHLHWINSGNLPVEQISAKGLSGRGYHVDIQSIQIHFGLWKKLHEIVRTKNKPLPLCSQIVPCVVASWNKNKVFIDVMSRYLLHIKIPFKSSSPILQVIVRFIMYLTVNGFLATQYGSLADSELFKDPNISHM